jgi:hypothetical protein
MTDKMHQWEEFSNISQALQESYGMYSEQIRKLSLWSGILGILIASSGLVMSALLREPVYVVCSFLLASVAVVLVSFQRKRLERLQREQHKEILRKIGELQAGSASSLVASYTMLMFLDAASEGKVASPPQVHGTATSSSQNIKVKTEVSAQPRLAHTPA